MRVGGWVWPSDSLPQVMGGVCPGNWVGWEIMLWGLGFVLVLDFWKALGRMSGWASPPPGALGPPPYIATWPP